MGLGSVKNELIQGLRAPPFFPTKKNPAVAGHVDGQIDPCFSALEIQYSAILWLSVLIVYINIDIICYRYYSVSTSKVWKYKMFWNKMNFSENSM